MKITKKGDPITDRQFDYIVTLAEKVGVVVTEAFQVDTRKLTKKGASMRIDELKKRVLEQSIRQHRPEAVMASKYHKTFTTDETPIEATPGYYVSLSSDVVYCVKWNKAKTHTYAVQLVINGNHAKWVYAPGIGKTLANLTPLSIDEAKRLGRLHGVCVVCAKPLTKPDSVELGMGAVCAAKLQSRRK